MKPPTRPVTVNGVTLGPGSPLATQRTHTAPEFSVQAGLIELLVGPIRRGDRIPGAGLTGRIPELILIHAIPNGASASSATAAAKRKAEGQLRGMPDLCWPVARGPFLTLYLETKRESGKARARQLEVHALLRAAGHCVIVYDSVQNGLNVVLGYDALGRNRLSVRGVTGWTKGTALIEVLRDWRAMAYQGLSAAMIP